MKNREHIPQHEAISDIKSLADSIEQVRNKGLEEMDELVQEEIRNLYDTDQGTDPRKDAQRIFLIGAKEFANFYLLQIIRSPKFKQLFEQDTKLHWVNDDIKQVDDLRFPTLESWALHQNKYSDTPPEYAKQSLRMIDALAVGAAECTRPNEVDAQEMLRQGINLEQLHDELVLLLPSYTNLAKKLLDSMSDENGFSGKDTYDVLASLLDRLVEAGESANEDVIQQIEELVNTEQRPREHTYRELAKGLRLGIRRMTEVDERYPENANDEAITQFRAIMRGHARFTDKELPHRLREAIDFINEARSGNAKDELSVYYRNMSQDDAQRLVALLEAEQKNAEMIAMANQQPTVEA